MLESPESSCLDPVFSRYLQLELWALVSILVSRVEMRNFSRLAHVDVSAEVKIGSFAGASREAPLWSCPWTSWDRVIPTEP